MALLRYTGDILPEIALCHRCKAEADQWVDGPAAGKHRRALCNACEYADWRATARSLNAPQG